MLQLLPGMCRRRLNRVKMEKSALSIYSEQELNRTPEHGHAWPTAKHQIQNKVDGRAPFRLSHICSCARSSFEDPGSRRGCPSVRPCCKRRATTCLTDRSEPRKAANTGNI